MSEHKQALPTPHAPVAFGAVRAAEQMRSSSDHRPTNAKSAQSEHTTKASVEKSVRPPRNAENLPSTTVAQTIARRLAGKE